MLCLPNFDVLLLLYFIYNTSIRDFSNSTNILDQSTFYEIMTILEFVIVSQNTTSVKVSK